MNVDWQAELARHDRWLRTIAYARLGEREGVEVRGWFAPPNAATVRSVWWT